MDPLSEIPGAASLWRSVSGGDPAIRIAIIDGPVDLSHPSLSGARLTASDHGAVSKSAIKSEHGTHVASLIVGAPGSPVVGLAPNCAATIYSIYEEGDNGELLPSSQAALALAINRALAEGADVINISSGQLTPTGEAQRILNDAVRSCLKAGKLIVAAAGNDGCRCLQTPASLQSVLAVGACDLTGRPAPYSNFGDAYLENGILAPGEDVKGASPSLQVALRSGTSFAAPIVTGVAALLLSLQRLGGGDADPRFVREALLASASPCPAADNAPAQQRCLKGVLNIGGAVRVVTETVEAKGARVSMASFGSALQGETGGETMSTLDVTTNERDAAVFGSEGVGVRAAAVTPSEAPAAQAGAKIAPSALESGGPANLAVAPAGSLRPAAVGGEAPFGGVRRSEAGCGCGGVRPSQAHAPQMAFPIGQLYYDFGKEARLDYFVQAIASWRDGLTGRGDPNFGPNRPRSADTSAPYNPEIMTRYLINLAPGEQNPPPGQTDLYFRDADALIWTLTIDTTPIYAIKPLDVFGLGFYISLVQALWYQEVSPLDPGKVATMTRQSETPTQASDDSFPPPGSVTRVSLAGFVDANTTTKLLNGTVVPTLVADWRGFYQWNIYTLLGGDPSGWPPGAEGFLERIYNEFRNVGVSSQDRALNYSAMNALNTKQIFAGAAKSAKSLDTVEVDRSAICRPDSDCWDVTYRFFDPQNVLTQARDVYQYTIDVSDTVPVPVGKVRQWKVY